MADKIEPTYPKATVNLNFKVDGVFALPEQWKTTDQANPGMFTYTIKFCNMQITNGKIQGRQLTQKQLRQQQQAKKKGGKKEAKKEQNPAEAQKLKEMLERQEAQERKREQAWSKMSEQQRFYSASEDKYKSPILKFENNSVQKQFNGSLFVVLEERILKDRGEWIYLYKTPTANEQDLQKLKKSKPKNLNIADLNPVCMRAWVNLESLNSCEVSQAQDLRCKIQQVDAVQETPKPNLQKSYLKLSLTLSEPILEKEDKYTVASIIKDPPEPKQISAEVKCVEQMQEQLRLAIQSLAMEYSAMFWRDLNANQQQKSTNIFVTNKKNEHSRRKQQFLYDFNVSGKYKVLKQRLKKIIVHLCESKFINKMEGKSFTGITCSVRDQFYSEIYNFLVTSYSERMEWLIEEKKQKLKEVLVLNNVNKNKITEEYLQEYRKESQKQRFERIIKEYLLIGNFQYGQEMYKNAILKEPNNIQLKYQYSIFSLKNRLNTLNQVLAWGYIDQFIEFNKDNQQLKITYAILMIGSEQNKSLKKAWIILRELLKLQPSNIKFLLLASLTAELLNKPEISQKIKQKAFREQLRKNGKIKQSGRHNTQPMSTQIPSLQGVATYKSELKGEEKDNLWIDAMGSFSELGIYNIVEKIKGKLQMEENPKMRREKIKILYNQQQYSECRQKAIALYKEGKDFEVLQIIINCCEKLKQPNQKIKYLKIALMDAPHDQKGYALINLAFFYISTHKYGNAKACLTKFLDANQHPGGLSWMMLGESELKCNNYETAIECFRHSNLCDPYNKEVWVWLAEAYAKVGNFVMVNQCLNCYLEGESSGGKILKTKLSQLKEALQKQTEQLNFYEGSIKEKLCKKLEAY